jgi:hypothetical protein
MLTAEFVIHQITIRIRNTDHISKFHDDYTVTRSPHFWSGIRRRKDTGMFIILAKALSSVRKGILEFICSTVPFDCFLQILLSEG